ncbi:MAG: hypothetical protein ACFB2X_12730 [Rivularia sp. (in: cyanobacteria)]
MSRLIVRILKVFSQLIAWSLLSLKRSVLSVGRVARSQAPIFFVLLRDKT